MEIYIAVFAGLLSTLVLVAVYLADRYEREPIELIQNAFLSGLLAQLVLILAATVVVGAVTWSGLWMLLTVVGVAIVMPFQLHRQAEMDERFDGVVYTVAFAGGATCAIHLNNLPGVIAASPFHTALDPGAEPDLRDLLILAGSPGFTTELGRGLVVIAVSVVVGAIIGTLHLRDASPGRVALIGASVAVSAAGIDLLSGGSWVFRFVLVAVAVATAFVIKRRSVFRDRPEPAERDLIIMGLKTVLMVFGAALLATVVLQAAVERPEPLDEVTRPDHGSIDRPSKPVSP